jgi:hypothetical protein
VRYVRGVDGLTVLLGGVGSHGGCLVAEWCPRTLAVAHDADATAGSRHPREPGYGCQTPGRPQPATSSRRPSTHTSPTWPSGRERLGVHLWSKQAEIAQAVVDHRRTPVMSRHDVGKFLHRRHIAGWWIDTHPAGEAFAVNKAPTYKQVQRLCGRRSAPTTAAATCPAGHVSRMGGSSTMAQLVGNRRRPVDTDEHRGLDVCRSRTSSLSGVAPVAGRWLDRGAHRLTHKCRDTSQRVPGGGNRRVVEAASASDVGSGPNETKTETEGAEPPPVEGLARRPSRAFALVGAEAAGFEPARGFKTSTRLAGGRHRPD